MMGLSKMSNSNYHLQCVMCKASFDEQESYTRCLKCGGSLDIVYDYDLIFERLNKPVLKTAPVRALKYIDFFPINDLRKVVTLYEGGTPFFRCKNLGKTIGMKNLFIKNEGLNPTGAFKDRGTLVEITKAVEMNKKAAICASTGNMAASVSAYSAHAHMVCHILTPEGTAIGKMSQTLSYGARMIQVRGTYDDANKLAAEVARRHKFFLAGDYAFRLEGQKSTGFEIAEQLGWESPDKVIVPVGCGTHLSGIWKGFKEFKMGALIDKLPSMVAVQAKGADPLVGAFAKKISRWEVIEKPQTIAGAIQIGDPLDGVKTLRALHESKGLAESATDEEILEAEKMLAKQESVFVEPSGAAPLAALLRLLRKGKIHKDERVVLVLTGAGLKDPLSALKVLPSPPSTEPFYHDIKKFLSYGYYNVYAKNIATNEILFRRAPTASQVGNVVRKKFNLSLTNHDIRACREHVESEILKGKSVTLSDLKLILEDIFKYAHATKRVLSVSDYHIDAGMRSKPVGKVKIEYKGKSLMADSIGVGPVDAIIRAISAALKGVNGVAFRLTDYHVDIASRGTDAVVEVKMTLMDKANNKVIGVGTSPDIIAASVEAFEEGYNVLHSKGKGKS